MTCQWCGDKHGADQLCQRAQKAMTRRSFCFLFGAGVAAAMLPNWAIDHRPIIIKEWPLDWYVKRVTDNGMEIPIAYGYGNIDGLLHGNEVVMTVEQAKAFFKERGVGYGIDHDSAWVDHIFG